MYGDRWTIPAGHGWHAPMAAFLLMLAVAACAGVSGLRDGHDAVPRSGAPSGIAVTPDGTTLYITDAGMRRIVALDPATGFVRAAIPLDHAPSGCALSADGAMLYVTGGGPEGRVDIIDTARGKVVATIPAGHSPCAPVLSPDGHTLYAAERFDTAIAVIDTRTRRVTGAIPMMREPVAQALTPDGGTLVVANHLPASGTIAEYTIDGGYMNVPGYDYGAKYANWAYVILASTRTLKLSAMVLLPPGSTDLRGVCVSPDGRYAYVTHVLARYGLPTTRLDRGWMSTAALTVIDLATCTRTATVLLDDIDHGAANPWGVACTPDGRRLAITHAGTYELSLIDRAALHDRLDRAARGIRVTPGSAALGDVQNDLGFLAGIRRRIPLAGNGPRDLAIADGMAYTAEYFSGSVGVIAIADTGRGATTVRTIALGPDDPPSREWLGERYFNDAALCFQGWQSCATCHPEGRSDGLTWDLLNDGLGNPKGTKSLLFTDRTPPAMVTGIRPDSPTAVRAGMRYILFAGLEPDVATAIDAYLAALHPVPSPRLVKGGLTRTARRGRKVFYERGCADCHAGPLATDLRSYDVGIGRGRDWGRAFDTPTLAECWRTSPYLYDHRALSMYEVLITCNPADRHGRTFDVTVKELDDLIEYVLSR